MTMVINTAPIESGKADAVIQQISVAPPSVDNPAARPSAHTQFVLRDRGGYRLGAVTLTAEVRPEHTLDQVAKQLEQNLQAALLDIYRVLNWRTGQRTERER